MKSTPDHHVMRMMVTAAIATLICVVAVNAQLSGPQSGTLGPGSYTVVGNISVDAGNTLTILPGTEFLHQGSFYWNIYGQLIAEGTERDSIIFKRYLPNQNFRWRGLRFHEDSTPTNSLDYCVIEHCWNGSSPINVHGGGIRSNGADITIRNSRISNCTSFFDGGGIWAINANIIVDHCTIVDNYASELGNGGGINLEYCPTAQITNSLFVRNSTTGN